jgi:hypothetical protein
MSVKNRRAALIFFSSARDVVGDQLLFPANLPVGISLLPVEWKAAWVKKPVQIFFEIEGNLLSLWGDRNTIRTSSPWPSLLTRYALSNSLSIKQDTLFSVLRLLL